MVTVPNVHCPLPKAMNPHAEAAEHFVAEWAERFHLVDTGLALGNNRVGHLSAYVHPWASAEAVKIGAAWTTWLFAYDDLLVERPQQGDGSHLRRLAGAQEHILAALCARTAEPVPEQDAITEALTAAIRDIQSSVRRLCPTWDWTPFTDDLRRFFHANLWEIGNTVRGRSPRLGAYLPMRRHTSAFFPSYRISAALAGIRLPLDVSSHVIVKELEGMACNYGSWLNDLYSFERERAEGCVHSMVPILRQEFGYEPQEAAEHIVEMCRIEMDSYLELKSRLPEIGLGLTGELGRYLNLLEYWMSGSLYWYQMSPRYNRAEERLETPRRRNGTADQRYRPVRPQFSGIPARSVHHIPSSPRD